MKLLAGRTADDLWRTAVDLFAPWGEAKEQQGRGGSTLELLHVVCAIEDPRQRWIVSRTPALNPAFALVEVLWIAAGRQDASLVGHWNPRLASFCGSEPDLDGAYGYRLRTHFGLDQLDRAYQALRANPDTRQVVLGIWDPAADMPRTDGSPKRADVPCNVLALPKIRSGKLEWMQVLRSNDLFLGLPYNIVQFTTLQEILAGWLGVDLGPYHQMSDSLHVYARDVEAVRRSDVSVAAATNTDSFALDRQSWDQVSPNVLQRLEALAHPGVTRVQLRSLAFMSDTPDAYEHAIRIAAADSARRRGWEDTAEVCVERVANPALLQLWDRWCARVRRPAEVRVS